MMKFTMILRTFLPGLFLALLLSTSTQAQDCYALRWARYATGIQLQQDSSGVNELQTAFREDGKFKDLLVDIATSDMFRYRRQGNAGGQN